MRLLAPIALAALALTACSGPCKELGDRLCQCAPSGTSRDTCQRQVDDALAKQSPSQSQCNAWLDSCTPNPPGGAQFCEWLLTDAGKSACGISYPTPPATGP